MSERSVASRIFEVYYDSSRHFLVAEEDTNWRYLSGHIHTTYSDGRMSPQQAVAEAINVGAHAIAVTDHDTIYGSLKAQEFAGDRITTLIGSEVTSADGHILAIGIKKDVAPNKSAEYTIKAIHAQGGVAIGAHPDLPHIDSLTSSKLREIIGNQPQEGNVDGIEVYNGSVEAISKIPVVGKLILSDDPNGHAKFVHESIFADGAAFGGADAHAKKLDKVITAYKGKDPVTALRNKETAVFINPRAINIKDNSAEAFALGRGLFVTRARKLRTITARKWNRF